MCIRDRRKANGRSGFGGNTTRKAVMSSSATTSTAVQIVVEAYLLGSIPFGYLLYRLRQGGDVRSIGSGNTGATNVLRGAGFAAGAATLALDGVKGYLAVALAGTLTD